MSALHSAVERIASLKPLVAAGAMRALDVVVAGHDVYRANRAVATLVAMALGTTVLGAPAVVGIALAQAANAVQRAAAVNAAREAKAGTARADADASKIDVLRHGLRAIATADLSTFGARESVEAIQAMAKAALEDTPYAAPQTPVAKARSKAFRVALVADPALARISDVALDASPERDETPAVAMGL